MTSNPKGIKETLDEFEPKVTKEMNSLLRRSFTSEEIKRVFFIWMH